jgi:hypothetical protein
MPAWSANQLDKFARRYPGLGGIHYLSRAAPTTLGEALSLLRNATLKMEEGISYDSVPVKARILRAALENFAESKHWWFARRLFGAYSTNWGSIEREFRAEVRNAGIRNGGSSVSLYSHTNQTRQGAAKLHKAGNTVTGVVESAKSEVAMAEEKELWLCRSSRTNHVVTGKEEGGRWQTLCNLDLVANTEGFWSDANSKRPLCIPCHAVAQRRFRKTHPREHYVPKFLKDAPKK